jgi:acetyltransferase-like isoleucine patch superfamily enzyme
VIHGGGKFVVGQNVSLRATPRLPIELFCAPGAVLTLEDGCFLNQGVHIACNTSVHVGASALLADQVLVMDTDFHAVGKRPIQSAPVTIEANTWIGARAIILQGVTIGQGTVVGAGSVVTHSLPANVVAAGNPARILRQI